MKGILRTMRSPAVAYSLLAIFFTLLTAWYIFRQQKHFKPENLTSHIESVTEERWQLLKQETGELLKRMSISGEPWMLTLEADAYQGAGMSFLVMKNKQIVYWSDNTIPLESITDSILNQRILELPNGVYQLFTIRNDSLTILGLSKVYSTYPYNNRYLKNGFFAAYNLPGTTGISTSAGNYNIKGTSGDHLFSVVFPSYWAGDPGKGTLPFLLFLAAFIFLNMMLLHIHRKLNPFPTKPNLFLLFFIIDSWIIRFLLYYFSFPEWIYQLPVFDPVFFASSALNRSLGDLILNVVWLVLVSYAGFRYLNSGRTNEKRPEVKWSIAILSFLMLALMLYIALAVCKILITDSTQTLSFSDLGNTGNYGLVSLALMAITAAAAMLTTWRLMKVILAIFPANVKYWVSSFPVLLLSAIPLVFNAEALNMAFPLLLVLLIAGFAFTHYRKPEPVVKAIMLIILVSSGLTWMINSYSDKKGQENRIAVASEFARKEDPMAEFLYNQARGAIYQDTLLAGMLFSEPIEEESLIKYLLQKYFSGGEQYWSRYNFQVTICGSNQKLSITGNNEVTGCYDFFARQMVESGIMTQTEDLALMQDPEGHHSYLGILRFENATGLAKESKQIFLEIFPRVLPSGTGYLELMADQTLLKEGNLNLYSNARYLDGQLVASYGKYNYSTDLSSYPIGKDQPYFFFSKGGYSHLYYRTGQKTVLLVSSPEKVLQDQLAPLSVFLLIFLLMLAFVWLLNALTSPERRSANTFRGRLRITLMGVVLVSFFIVGATSIYYIRILNRNKNTDNLKDKARSLRIELEHKLADKEILSSEMQPYIWSLLMKFNEVFATDINLFDAKGNLLGSSRQQLFEEGIIGKKINPEAFREMALFRKTLLIHEEEIGMLAYLSAYIPFRNNQGKVIAYINLPYFARQSELTSEISSFMMAFINIYLILIALAILIAFALAGMILKPLVLLQEKIRKVTLGGVNEKLVWTKKDEIGDLVDEYNRMIDELDRSADLLARSERESAWKEMARQVAHEIKNPLTPMKLNLQHLEKTMADENPAWKDQFARYAKMMHHQIESLSQIASAFSDFANMPEMKPQEVSLKEALTGSVSLFENYPAVNISLDWHPDREIVVRGDPEQIGRLFINILSNAVQSGDAGRDTDISVRAAEEGKYCRIDISDNGKGIDEDIREKIFLPNFTTRSSGTGLGLAIARSIANHIGGDIGFVSETGKGTTFTITLPVLQKHSSSF